MGKGSSSGTVAWLIRTAGACGIISQLAGGAFLLLAVFRSPWFSWTENYLSVLGAEGSATALYNSGLVLTGLFSLMFAIGLGGSLLAGSWLGRSGMMSLVLGSSGLAVMGIFPRTAGLPHDLASLAFFVFTSLAIVLVGIMAIATSKRGWGVLSLMAVIFVVPLQLAPRPWGGGAVLQIISCLPWSLWTIALGVRLLLPIQRAGCQSEFSR